MSSSYPERNRRSRRARAVLVPLQPKTFSAAPLRPTAELLNDAAFDMESYLSDAISRRMFADMARAMGAPAGVLGGK